MKTANYKFGHVGVPTDKPQEGEQYFAEMKLYCTDPNKTEYNIEYIRPEPGCTFFPILLEKPHVQYMVDDLEEAIKGENVVVPPFAPWPGRMIAFIDVNGFIFELAKDD
jgi:hypothetical protein